VIVLVKPFQGKKQSRLGCLILGILFLSHAWAFAADDITKGGDAVLPNESGVRISDIQVVIDSPPDQQGPHAAMAKHLIRMKPGDSLSEGAVQAAIEALKLSHRFSAIHVDSTSESMGEKLTFTLTPYRYVKDIRIRGKYPLFEKDIFNQMTIYPGDPYTRADLSAQTEAIIERYRREGYINPRVSVRAQRDPDDENAVILVDIDKGPHYVLGMLTFEGNRSVSPQALKRRMKIWRATLLPGIGRFSEYRLKKDMESLLAYHRKKGFVDAELSYRIDSPDDSHRVDVTIKIQEGRRYTVAFEGNQRFWDLTLKKDVVIFTNGNRSNIGIRKSVQNIKKRYREAGFLDARVKVETDDVPGNPADIRRLRFTIQEGPQTIVEAVTIAGNQTLSEKEVKKQLLTRPPTVFHDGAFVPETLDEDTYAVTTLYMKKGFTERSVDGEVIFNEDNTAAAVSLNIEEGPQTMVRSIAIQGLTEVTETAARKVLVHKVGKPFRKTALEREKEALASLVSEKGYPHATVSADVAYSEDRSQADIIHTVVPGQKVTLGEIYISGNLRTAEKVIRRELEVKPKSPLSIRSLHDGQRRLRDLDIFHGVSYRTFGLQEMDETVDLFVDIEENDPYYAQISGGYESSYGFYGRTKVGDHNLFGWNKKLWVSGEVGQTGYRLETRLTEPRIFGTHTSASIGLFNDELIQFNQPFGTRTTGGSLGFGRQLGKYVTTALNFRLEKRDQFSVDVLPTDQEEDAPRTIFVTTPYIQYDRRDSFVRPTKGFYSSLSVSFSKGIQDPWDDFIRYFFDFRYFKTPFDRVTFAGLARIGQVITYPDAGPVYNDQLFYLGGIRDVRGFKQNLLRFDSAGNPLGGKTAIVGSLEARIDLGMDLELTTFFDTGSVRDVLVAEGSDSFRSSVGVGLRYITPIGPMGLLYGYKLNPEEGESPGRFHLSIGYTF